MRISDWSSDVCSSDLGGLHCHSALAIFMEKPRHTGGRQHQWPGQFPSQHCPTHVYRTNVMQIIGDQRITIECSGVGGPGQFIVGSTFDIMVERSREPIRSEEHTSELQSLMRISYAVFCLTKK